MKPVLTLTLALTFAFSLGSLNAQADESRGSAVKSAVEEVVSDMVNAGKDAASAGKDAFRTGREAATDMVDSVGEGIRSGLGRPTPDAPPVWCATRKNWRPWPKFRLSGWKSLKTARTG